MSRSTRTIKNGISHILSILFILVVTILGMILALYLGAFNPSVITSNVLESGYYEEVHKELNIRSKEILDHSFHSLSNEDKVSENILGDIISLERVYISSREYMNDTLGHKKESGSRSSLSTTQLKDDLYASMTSYLGEKNIEITSEIELGLKELVTRIEQEYIRGISFQFIQYLSNYRYEFLNIGRWLIPVLLLVLAILVAVLLMLPRFLHRGLRTLTNSMFVATVLVVFVSGFGVLTAWYEQLGATPSYYNNFLIAFGKESTMALFMIGIGYLFLSFTLVFLTALKKKHMSKKERR